MNDDVVDELIQLGMTGYEAKIYVALVGMGEGSARQLSDASGVPRPRVYDILELLERRGCVEVGQGSPKLFRAVEPEKMMRILRDSMDDAMVSAESRLKELSQKSKRSTFPVWHIKGEMTIRNQLSSMIAEAQREIIIISLKNSLTRSLIADLVSRASKVQIACIVQERSSGFRELAKGIKFVVPSFGKDSLTEYYEKTLFGKGMDADEYRMQFLMTVDERRSIFIYESNGERAAIIFELPIIAMLQTTTLKLLIEEHDD